MKSVIPLMEAARAFLRTICCHASLNGQAKKTLITLSSSLASLVFSSPNTQSSGQCATQPLDAPLANTSTNCRAAAGLNTRRSHAQSGVPPSSTLGLSAAASSLMTFTVYSRAGPPSMIWRTLWAVAWAGQLTKILYPCQCHCQCPMTITCPCV